jgi:3-oxoacyl-[acyl-carrier-protein] synthase I
MNKDVIITGRGLVTPLGSGLKLNEEALLNGSAGIKYVPEWKEVGLESQVCGLVNEDEIECPLFNKKNLRYMAPNARYGVVAAYEAITEAGYTIEDLNQKNVAVVLGHGGSAHQIAYAGARTLIETGKSKRVSPFTVPRAMDSCAAGNISLILGLKGESYSISSACASSAHSIMLAARLIRSGEYDVVVTGGTEEVNWIHALGFDAMRAISKKYNNCPEKASRPFDKERDGFVIAAGAGILILESAEHAEKRGAKKLAKISGFAANSNATDMVVPNADASALVMSDAIKDAGLKPEDIDYINTHGTSTPVGDPVEINAIKKVFYDTNPKIKINSTKSQTGHTIGATGAIELIYATQMMEKNFVSGTINLENPDDNVAWANIIKKTIKNTKINHTLSNSLGFGGTNCCLVVSKV